MTFFLLSAALSRRGAVRADPVRGGCVAWCAVIMASDENSFFGLKVPEGTDRRELYKSQYRAIYTCKLFSGSLANAGGGRGRRGVGRLVGPPFSAPRPLLLSLTRASPLVSLRACADKMSAGELDQAFREAVTGDGPDGGWSIKNDERVKYVGKLEVAKGEDTTLKVRADSPSHPPSPPRHPLTSSAPCVSSNRSRWRTTPRLACRRSSTTRSVRAA